MVAMTGEYRTGVPGAAACTRHSVPIVSQLAARRVPRRLPGAVAPCSGIGMIATGTP